jgi:VanZ family protein
MGWVILISWLSLTGSDISKLKFRLVIPSDKIAHFCMYAGLSFLFYRSLILSGNQNRMILHILLALILATAYSTLLEFMQEKLTIERQADFWDVVANFTGALAGCLLLKPVNGFLIKRFKFKLL